MIYGKHNLGQWDWMHCMQENKSNDTNPEYFTDQLE